MSVVSDPIANASDGTLPTGSFDVTILETGTAYIADNFSWDENSKKASSMSARGRNNRNKVIVTDITGSADFQLADVTTTAPRPRATFAIDADGDGNTEPYTVEKSGKAFTQDGETKCKTSIFANASPCIYDVTTGLAPAAGAGTASSPISATHTLAAYTPRDVTLSSTPYTASNLPTGLSMNSTTGVVTGTPTTSGTSIATYKVAATRTVDGVSETLSGIRKVTWVIA